jgi:hypothetical protein
MVSAHAEQRQPQFPIPTCTKGKVLGLKTKWHNSVRSIRNNILRWDIRNYRDHSTEWDWVFRTLMRDLDILYSYEPYPLCRSYLSNTISDDRKEWKRFYFETGRHHEHMPDAAFNAWQPWWVSEEGMAKCQQMKELRAMRTQKQSQSLNLSSSSGASPQGDMFRSPTLRSPVECASPQVTSLTLKQYLI